MVNLRNHVALLQAGLRRWRVVIDVGDGDARALVGQLQFAAKIRRQGLDRDAPQGALLSAVRNVTLRGRRRLCSRLPG